jgi:hypothetical protein
LGRESCTRPSIPLICTKAASLRLGTEVPWSRVPTSMLKMPWVEEEVAPTPGAMKRDTPRLRELDTEAKGVGLHA